MNTLAAIAIILSALFGTPATEAPVTETVATVSLEESSARTMEQDAMVTWSDYIHTPMTEGNISYTWEAYAYEEPQNLKATQLKLKSLDLGIWYVYSAYVTTNA